MVLFDFKSDKHFVTSSDETTIRVCELRDLTIHPSYIRKAHWKEVSTIIVDSDDNGDDDDLAEEQYYDGLLFFDGHGKIDGQEALTKLAQHLTRSGLMVSPGGYCFQDVTELGEHKELGVHYLRLNDLFSWPRHGVDLARITSWQRLELKYTIPRKRKISKQPTVGGGVSKEKYEELKRILNKKDEELEKAINEMEDEIQKLRENKEEELQKLREEMEETIEKKDMELRKANRRKDEEKRPKPMTEGVSKEKYEGLRRILRERDEELEKMREDSEEDLQKLRDEKDEEIRKLKEEMEDASEKHEEEFRKLRKERDEMQKQLKKNDGVQQTLIKRGSDDLQKLRKEKAEELRKLREEMQEEIEKARKKKYEEEVEAWEREKDEGANPSREPDEELKKPRDEVETLRWTRLPTTQVTTDEAVHKRRRRAVPPTTWSSEQDSYMIYRYENNMKADFCGFFQGILNLQVVDEDTRDWPAPPKITVFSWESEAFDRNNWWFVKMVHPTDGGRLTMLAYYDGDRNYTTGFRGYPTRLAFGRGTITWASKIFFMIYLFGEFKLAFMYRD